VSAITKGSPASKSTIQMDDKLIAINGTNVVNATIEEVVTFFRQSPRLLTLTVATLITKRISALGMFSGPNLAKGGSMREEERAFAEQLDAAVPTTSTGNTDPVTGPDTPVSSLTSSSSAQQASSSTHRTGSPLAAPSSLPPPPGLFKIVTASPRPTHQRRQLLSLGARACLVIHHLHCDIGDPGRLKKWRRQHPSVQHLIGDAERARLTCHSLELVSRLW
jgi:hypothetical protein